MSLEPTVRVIHTKSLPSRMFCVAIPLSLDARTVGRRKFPAPPYSPWLVHWLLLPFAVSRRVEHGCSGQDGVFR